VEWGLLQTIQPDLKGAKANPNMAILSLGS